MPETEDPELLAYLANKPTATPRSVDFSQAPDLQMHRDPRSKNHDAKAPRNERGLIMTPERVKARARRKAERAKLGTDDEFEMISPRPVEEWDLEELAKGRPKNALGTFAGPAPKWVSRQVHEAAMTRFQSMIKSEMNGHTLSALKVVENVLANEEVDEKGKPIVPASTKLDAAKFLVEHAIGKPTQRVEQDISVKLQGILGTVMVTPDQSGQGVQFAHLPGVTMPLAISGGEDDDYIDADA